MPRGRSWRAPGRFSLNAEILTGHAAALDPRISQVVAVETLASYVSAEPYRQQRFGIVVPGFLREVGDVCHLAALAAPRRLVIAGGLRGNGQAFTPEEFAAEFQYTQRAYGLERASEKLTIDVGGDAKAIVGALQ